MALRHLGLGIPFCLSTRGIALGRMARMHWGRIGYRHVFRRARGRERILANGGL